uniref:Uncharacterized protein n=1 Tax=Arundo donax TaxID=35708 RepID=A0A0A9FJ24_ARUDO
MQTLKIFKHFILLLALTCMCYLFSNPVSYFQHLSYLSTTKACLYLSVVAIVCCSIQVTKETETGAGLEKEQAIGPVCPGAHICDNNNNNNKAF